MSMDKPPKIESQEQPRPSLYRTIERVVLETLPTGESVEQLIECNGITHRRCVDKVSYDAEGNIIFAESVPDATVELGPCDKNHA